MTVVEFLEARIAEDERECHEMLERTPTPEASLENGWDHEYASRVRDETAAKREVVQYVSATRADRTRGAEADAQYRAAWWIATRLASVYKDHPDYQPEWAHHDPGSCGGGGN